MTYTKSYTAWANYPTTTTPATAAKLQNMDDGISTNDTAATALSASTVALSASTVALSASTVALSASTVALSAQTVALSAANVTQDTTIAAVSARAYSAIQSISAAAKSLSADVTMTAATGGFYDGPQLTVTAGTWFFSGTVTLANASASIQKWTGKLWDGTTVIASAEQSRRSTAGEPQHLALSGFVVAAVSATYKISVATIVDGALIVAATPDNSAGNNASTLTGIKIA